MAIPDYQACVLPLLKEARGRQRTQVLDAGRRARLRLCANGRGDVPAVAERLATHFGCEPRDHQLYHCDSDGFANWKSNVREANIARWLTMKRTRELVFIRMVIPAWADHSSSP